MKIKICENAKYDGQDMKWTETPTHIVELKKGDKVYHVSTSMIKKFQPKEMCFYNCSFDDISIGYTKYVYEFEILENMAVQGYSNDDEVRFEISEKNCKVILLGKWEVKDTYTLKEILNRRGRRENVRVYDREWVEM